MAPLLDEAYVVDVIWRKFQHWKWSEDPGLQQQQENWYGQVIRADQLNEL